MKTKQQMYAKNVHVSFPLSRSEFFDVIGLFAKSQTLRVNAKRLQRGERKGKLLLEIFLFFAVFFLTDFADKEGLFSVYIVKPF